MTQIFSIFRFRRWSQEKKASFFRAGFQLMFAVFVVMAIILTWRAVEKDIVLGVVVGLLTFALVIGFDLLMRAAFFLSENHRDGKVANRDAVDAANSATIYAKQRVSEVESDLQYANGKLARHHDKFMALKSLMTKKRKGKTPRLSKSVKNCLAAFESDL